MSAYTQAFPVYESKLAYQVADAMMAERAAHQATKEPHSGQKD